MKKLIILILVMNGLAFSAHSQRHLPCSGSLPEPRFRKSLEMLKNQQNDAQRLKRALDLAYEVCLTSDQVRQISETFRADKKRLDFAQGAYDNTLDKENFYEVYDAFTRISNVFRLHDYIVTLQTTVQLPHQPILSTPHPMIALPPPCQVSDQEMSQLLESVRGQSFNSTKVSVAKQAISAKQCFSVLQIKEIMKLFSFEESKLDIAKYAYDFCMDKQNYYTVNDVFTFSASVDELTKYIQGKH